MLPFMDSFADSPIVVSPRAAAVPAWAQPRGTVDSEADAAFMAGAAMTMLYERVREPPAWAGCWRKRLALASAHAAVRLMGRREDETALRDAVFLCPAGGDPGPAGRVLVAYRRLASRKPVMRDEMIREVADLLSIRWDEALAGVPALIDELLPSRRAVPFVIAALVERVVAMRPDAEVLAWWLADWVLARLIHLDLPIPFFTQARYGAAFRTAGDNGRLRPGDEGFARAVCLALALQVPEMLRLATEIERRADSLIAVSPQLRTKGREGVVQRLLADDAVAASLPGTGLSRWAGRRLFERLEAFGVVRELSGRPTFRIYGL